MEVENVENSLKDGEPSGRDGRGEEVMAAAVSGKDYLDIYILCDTTGSMGNYVDSLVDTIIQIVAVTRILLPGRARIAVVSYKDYSDGEDCCTAIPLGSSSKDIVSFVRGLRASGGGDAPEATKTGLNRIANMIKQNADVGAKNLIIHYTDAPPHCEESQSQESHIKAERRHLRDRDPGFDWVAICRFFAFQNIPVYTFLTANSHGLTKYLMLHLGRVVLMRDTSPYNVTKATIGMLMHVLGQEFDYNDDFNMLGCDVRSKSLVGYRREGWGENGSGDGKSDEDMGAVGGEGNPRRSTPSGDNISPHLDLSRHPGIKDESRGGGLSPFREIYPHLSEKVPFHFPPIGIRPDVEGLLNGFMTDAAFQSVVFEVMSELFTPDSCLSLTYNPILGKLWRLVCRMRGDDRLNALRMKLSEAINGIRDARKQKQMKDWLENSYNAEEEIANLLVSPSSYEDERIYQRPCLILDPVAAIWGGEDAATVREALRSLARAPTPAGLALAQKLMTSLILVENPGVDLPVSPNSRNGIVVPLSLPVALIPKYLFGCLPHLASPGMMFSLRPAIMMAIVAFLSGNKYLVDKAEAFLKANVGQWINLGDVSKIPEVLSEETIKLLRRVPQFLTDEEKRVYDKLFLISRLRLAFRKEFQIKLALSPDLKNVFADYRFRCVDCQFHRSFTLLGPGGRCGLCIYKALNPGVEYEIVASDVEDQTGKSRLVNCGTCLAIYEVVKHQALNVKPKCHFCRLQKKPETVECGNCRNRYVLPDRHLLDRMRREGGETTTGWTCAICVTTPHLAFEQVPFLLKNILASNLHVMTVFNLVEGTFNVIEGRNSYFKIYTEMWAQMTEEVDGNGASSGAVEVFVKRRRVFDVEALFGEIKEAVEKGDLSDLCFLCCEEKLMSKLASSPCGHCMNKICFDCLRQWVNQIQPGTVVLPSHLVCPFCKMVPKANVFTQFNKPAKSLLHKEHLKRVVSRMDPSLYYGWCKGCSKIREIGPVECAGGDVPFSESDDFVCETCKTAVMSGPEVPKCPGCQAPTVKSFGCNHIQCPMCDTHWCYVCQKKFDRSTIYDHLVKAHGNIGLENDGGEALEDEMENDDDMDEYQEYLD